MKNSVATGLAALLLLPWALGLLVAGVLVRGLCLSVLWGWLIVPVFHLPRLSIAAALGLSLVLNFFHPTTTSNKKVSGVLGEMLAMLLTGYIIHLFL